MKNKLTAAPIFRKSPSLMPAPAYTDFVGIFLSDSLNKDESNVAIRHEQAHIWCEHNNRYRKDMDRGIWAIACELEIARNIYDADDLSVIGRPRSRLAGGYLPDSINELPPELMLAEEIYEWLKNNPDKIPRAQSMCSCDCSSGGSEDEESKAKTLVDAAKEETKKNKIQRQTQEDLSSKLNSIRYRQPTLADEMDALLRHRIVRERSFRRPSRRQSEADVIEKGRICSPKRPLIEIFVDRSGSFCAQKTAAAEACLKKILSKYNVQIRADTFFFGNDKLSHSDFGGGGNTPYHLIAQHIGNTHPKLAIVITDDDAAEVAEKPENTEVFCIPIGASSTKFSAAIGGKDVVF